MNGPEHYVEAERLLDQANHLGHDDPETAARYVAAAQIHATLAVAAATAMGLRGTRGTVVDTDLSEDKPVGMHPLDFRAWDKIAGVPA